MNPKKLIEPIQEWLLSQGRCSGCGRSLEECEGQWYDSMMMILCACHRIFMYNPDLDVYQRSIEEKETVGLRKEYQHGY
jgi:hypothetical protein